MPHRNWHLYQRKAIRELTFSWKFKLLFLVVIPLVLVCIKIHLSHDEVQSQADVFDKVDKKLLDSYFSRNEDDQLFYFPINNFTQCLVNEVRLRIRIGQIQGFTDEMVLEKAIESTTDRNRFVLIFHEIPNGRENGLKYTIRSGKLDYQKDLVLRKGFHELDSMGLDEYMASGFLALHTTITNVYTEQQNSTSPPIEFEHFPAQPSKTVVNMSITSFAAVLIIIYSLNTINTILIPMVDEKERGIRALLKITTRYFYFNDLTRFSITFVYFFLITTIVFGLTQYFQMWGQVSLYFPFLLTIFFALSLISYTMCLSLFFKTVENCKITGILFHLVPFFGFNLFHRQWLTSNIIYCFPSNVFFEGMKLIKVYVVTRRNIDLSFERQIPQQYLDETTPLHLFHIYLLLLLHTMVYLLIYSLLKYMESKCSARKIITISMSAKFPNADESPPERMGQSENTIIRIHSIPESFYSGTKVKEAVKNVSLDVQKSEMTVLLEHNNEAGKTTLMSIIAEELEASGVTINNLTYAKEYDEMIGYCPKRNVFINHFTCLENVNFFGELRGLGPLESARESLIVLNYVKLWSYANNYPNELSEEMKRRLSVAISVIGNTKIVIMDKPFSVLDPKSKQELWEILLKLKKNRTIVLSARSMEEIDLLADKVTIVEAPLPIVCEGTPMELNDQYTSGHILKIVTNPHFNENETEYILDDDESKFTLKPTIHHDSTNTDGFNYGTFFTRVVKGKKSLNTEDCTNPLLEEVHHSTQIPKADGEGGSDTRELDGPAFYFHMFYLQVKDVIIKKAVHLRNEWKYFLFLISLPFIALLLSITMIKFSMNGMEQNSLLLDFDADPMNQTIVVALNKIENSAYEPDKIMELLREIAPKINFQFVFDTDLEEYLLEASRQDNHHYNERIVSGIEMNLDRSSPHILVFYSESDCHSSVKSFNLVSNVFLKYSQNHQNSSIETLNRPVLEKVNHFYIYENLMPLGIFFYIVLFSMESYNVIRSQFESSLSSIASVSYWTVTYILDLVVHLIVLTLMTLVSIASSFYVDLFPEYTHETMGMIFFSYAVAIIPVLYLLQTHIKRIENLYSIIIYWAFTGVFLGQLSIEEHRGFEMENLLLYILPDFAVRHAMTSWISVNVLQLYDVVYYHASYVHIMIFEGIVIMIVLVLPPIMTFFYQKLLKCKFYSSLLNSIGAGNSYSDVEQEREATTTLIRSNSISSINS